MDNFTNKNKFRCKLCNNEFFEEEMSEEHYPARSTGNEDIVAIDLSKISSVMCSGVSPKQSLFATSVHIFSD